LTDISYEAKPVWRAYWPSILLGIATLIFSIGPFFILWAVFDRRLKRYTVKEQKAEACQGIFRKTSKSIELENLQSVELTRTAKQKLLGIGNLTLTAKESIGTEIIFADISKPAALKKQLDQFISNSGD
jgi:membrane protein YdbS with pleckstrin-like domain|tara:strand:- start:1683 stop:2069 length:387 start_codon:yes stop_codon:yes gene_type:complete